MNENYHNSNLKPGGIPIAELYFIVPPLPFYLMCGRVVSPIGDRHPRRSRLGVFDLLVVESGCLYMGEEGKAYEVTAGQAIILRPDTSHGAVRPNREETIYYWLHFTTTGSWEAREPSAGASPQASEDYSSRREGLRSLEVQPFGISIAQYTDLTRPERVFVMLEELVELEQGADRTGGSWKQQSLLQDLLQQLQGDVGGTAPTPSRLCADRAAAYLREHYKDEVTARELGASLNFHPGYIARCMQKELGCSPFGYLQRYRLEKAKLLLLQTSLSIAHIAGEAGFNQAAYFTSCFAKSEGMTPRDYRNRFWRG